MPLASLPRALSGLVALTVLTSGCSKPQPQPREPLATEPIGTLANVPLPGDPEASSIATSATASSGSGNPCSSGDFDALDQTLRQCEVPPPKSAELPTAMGDKLEVRLSSSSSTVAPGGRVEVTLVLRNKSSDALPLYFNGDPTPRFDVEAQDSKGRRVDVPAGKPPAWPKGTRPRTPEVKTSRIVLDKGRSARVRVTWEAMKMKWAPDKARSWEAPGYPRTSSGPLPNGRYTLTVKLPVVGLQDQNVDVPKVVVEVGS